MTKKPRNPDKATQGAHVFVSPRSGVAYTKDEGHQVMRKGKTARDRAKKGGRR